MNLDRKEWVLIVGQELELGTALQSDSGRKLFHRPVGKAYLFREAHASYIAPETQEAVINVTAGCVNNESKSRMSLSMWRPLSLSKSC